MSATQSRRAAGDLLFRVLEKHRTLDEAMVESDEYHVLEGADRGFARAIASGALRTLGALDQGLAPFMTRPLNAVSPQVRALLRVGASQLWCLGTPAHAAVNQTVEAARAWPEARSGGTFLNAVLRRVAENPPPDLDRYPISIWPHWLARAMEESLGQDGAAQLARAQCTEPPLHLSAKTNAARVAEMTGGTLLPSGSIELASKDVEGLAGFEDGDWWVQDAAAALPVRLLPFEAGEPVLDLCAAPGGKTLQLAARGARVMALDRSGPRLERLKDNLARTRLSAEVITADALTWTPPQPFKAILLDAPCSAHGTLRRHPEGAWIKSEADTARFAIVQGRLLERALGWLAPGGTLIYCVCSPLAHEGRDIVAAALTETGARHVPIRPEEVPGFEDCIRPDGSLVTLPRPDRAADAFYIARLTR